MKRIVLLSFVLFIDIACNIEEIQHCFSRIIKQEAILCRKNKLVRAAESDPYIVTRFFKELTLYPCLLVSNKKINQSIAEQLFPGIVICEVVNRAEEESIQKVVDDFVKAQNGYCAVLTNMGSDTLIVPQARGSSGVCVLPVDDILAACSGEIAHAIDIQKIFRLMKRRIRIICTAALIPIKYERRQNQYIRALNRIVEFCYNPYVVESCVQGPTFFDDYTRHVVYSKTNNVMIKNKGVNEFNSIIFAFNAWNFNNDDIVLKLTGRYFFMTDALIRFLEDSPDVDCAAKFEIVKEGPVGLDAVLTGCFAMRFDLFKQMLESFDYDYLERDFICVEHVVGPYFDRLAATKVAKVARQQRIDVEANVFFTQGSDEITYW